MISKSFHPIFRAVKEHSTASRSKLHRLEKREYDECEEKFHLACGCLFWAYKWYLILHNVTFPVYHRAVDTSCRGERRRPVKEEAADAQVVCKQIIMIIYDRFMRTAHFYLMPGPSLARLIGKLFRKIRRKSFFTRLFRGGTCWWAIGMSTTTQEGIGTAAPKWKRECLHTKN